jgi:hypothetical protein
LDTVVSAFLAELHQKWDEIVDLNYLLDFCLLAFIGMISYRPETVRQVFLRKNLAANDLPKNRNSSLYCLKFGQRSAPAKVGDSPRSPIDNILGVRPID